MPIFLDDVDYRRFIAALGDVVEEYDIRCWNYCLMPNHYHATLQPMLPNLSAAIRRLNGAYGHWWNRRHGRVGHVFQGRYKDQVVDREEYLVTLSRYVVMNPVRAGLVPRPEDWPWSSYRATVGLNHTPAFLSTELTLSLFGGLDGPAAQASFAARVALESDATLVDRIRSNERILGSRSFKEFVEKEACSPV